MVGLKALTLTKIASCCICQCAPAFHRLENFLCCILHPVSSWCLMEEEQACPSAQSPAAGVRPLPPHIQRQQMTLGHKCELLPYLDRGFWAVLVACSTCPWGFWITQNWPLPCLCIMAAKLCCLCAFSLLPARSGLLMPAVFLFVCVKLLTVSPLSILECLFLHSQFLFFIPLVRGQSILSSSTKKSCKQNPN